MLTIRYPLLFAGCGDGICMPFRGEKCYVRQCPECSEENLKNIVRKPYYGSTDYWKYPDCLNDNTCYDISKCFCPPKKDWGQDSWGDVPNCTNDVRDIYGCVIIRDINQEAEAECQCKWNRELVLTTAGKEPNEKHYCCPENSQIAFSHGINIIGEKESGLNINIPGANCGNLTIQLRKVASKQKYGPYNIDVPTSVGGLPVWQCVVKGGLNWDCALGWFDDAWSILNDNPPPAVIQAAESDFGTRNLDGYLTLKLNATYYKDGTLHINETETELNSEGYLRNAEFYNDEIKAGITLTDCECEEYYFPEGCVEFDGSRWYIMIAGSYPIKVKCYECREIKCSGFSMYGGLLKGQTPQLKRIRIYTLEEGGRLTGEFDIPPNLETCSPSGPAEEYWECYWTYAPPEGYVR